MTAESEQATWCHYLSTGLYLAAIIYDHKWYIGLITDRSDEGVDIISSPSSDLFYALSWICLYTHQIHDNTQSRASYCLTWPRHDDICCVPLQFVLCLVSASQARSNSACQYQLDNSVWKTVNNKIFILCTEILSKYDAVCKNDIN